MSRRRYDGTVLVEEWNDATQTYRRWSSSGSLLEQRAYTSAEIAAMSTLAGVTVDSSDVIMRNDSGTAMFRLGRQSNGDRGFTLNREDGTKALTVARLYVNGTSQEIRVFDRYGYDLLAEEALGSGLARPLLPIVMQPIQATASTLQAGPYGWEIPTVATAWTTMFQATYPRHNQYGTFKTMIAASDTTTSAEVRLVNAADSTHLGQFLAGPYTASRALGSTAFVEAALPLIFLPGNPSATVSIALQVRRTAGAGTLRVALTASNGG